MKTIGTVAAALTALAVMASAPSHAKIQYNESKGKTSYEQKGKKSFKLKRVNRQKRSYEYKQESKQPKRLFGLTSIRGRVTQTTIVGRNVNVASGKGALAKTTIGTIRHARIRGTVKQTTIVGRSTNVAVGKNATALTTIGAIQNADIRGKVEQTTIVQQNTNVAVGKGATACTEIGTIGDADNC